MMMVRFVLLFISIILLATESFAQCSDAGVCKLNSDYLSNEDDSFAKIRLDYIFARGEKEEKINYHTIQLAAALRIFDQNLLHIILPVYKIQDGPAGKTNGIGDLIITWEQVLYSGVNDALSVQIGSKLSNGSSNLKSLPMAYQPGLGSSDLLMNFHYSAKTWAFSAGYQKAEDNFNNSSPPLKRGDDLTFDASYIYSLKKLAITFKALAIKRLEKSQIIKADVIQTVPKSNPFQLNIGLGLQYPLNIDTSLIVQSYFATQKRASNIDGLTRAVTLGVGIQTSF